MGKKKTRFVYMALGGAPCPVCHGSGNITTGTCGTCGGRGWVMKVRRKGKGKG